MKVIFGVITPSRELLGLFL